MNGAVDTERLHAGLGRIQASAHQHRPDWKYRRGRGREAAIETHAGLRDNRIRVTASGQMRNCLFSNDEYDLRPLLAAGDPARLQQTLRRLVVAKPARHAMNEQEAGHAAFSMAQIGG
jgi:molybdenum cofactor biosynthesis enzyme MoaA